MKKILMIVAVSVSAFVANAQTNNTAVLTNSVQLAKDIKANRSLNLAVYPMYAPDIVANGKKDNFGMGVAILTPASVVPNLQGTFVGNHGFAGLRFDYLAHQAFASTMGVGMKGTVTVWNHDFTGFVHAGANIPISGFGQNNANLGGMAGGGVYTDIYRFSPNAAISIQGSIEKWTQFSGEVFLGGPVFNWSW